MDVPHVKREDYQLTDISDDGYLTLMSDNGDIREDLKLPEGDLGISLRNDFDNGKELLVSSLFFLVHFTSNQNFIFDSFSFSLYSVQSSSLAAKNALLLLRPILLLTSRVVLLACLKIKFFFLPLKKKN